MDDVQFFIHSFDEMDGYVILIWKKTIFFLQKLVADRN